MLDVLPVALGYWAEAERRCGHAERARELAREAATLLDEGHPSLLNEAPVFLALHDACVDLCALQEAKDAIARGIPRLVTRVQGLAGTPYARGFLTQLAPNAGLLAAAEAYGLVPRGDRRVDRQAAIGLSSHLVLSRHRAADEPHERPARLLIGVVALPLGRALATKSVGTRLGGMISVERISTR